MFAPQTILVELTPPNQSIMKCFYLDRNMYMLLFDL